MSNLVRYRGSGGKSKRPSLGKQVVRVPSRPVQDETAIFRVVVPRSSEGQPKQQTIRPDVAVKQFAGIVFRCASLNANAVAQLPLRLYAETTTGEKRSRAKTRPVDGRMKAELLSRPALARTLSKASEIEEVTDHPLIDMLEAVNPFENQYSTIEIMVIYLELLGNSYHYVLNNELGVPFQLWTLPAQAVRIIPSRKTLVGGYELGAGSEKVTYLPEEVIHYRYSNPADVYYGMGKLQAAGVPVQLRWEMQAFETALFQNSAVPELIISVQGVNSQDARDEIQTRWDDRYRGSANASKAAVVGGDVKVEKVGLSQKDMLLIDRLRLSTEEIAQIFGVPISKLTSEGVNRANAREGNVAYSRDTVKPIATRIEQQLNQDLVPRYDDTGTLFLAFDNPVPEDREERRAERESLLAISTINEQRSVDGLEPVEGGDDVLVDGRKVVLTSLGADGADGEADGPDDAERAFRTETGRSNSRYAKSPACRQDGETFSDCVSRKIPEIAHDDPSMEREQVVAIAHSMCRKPCKCTSEGGSSHVHGSVKASDVDLDPDRDEFPGRVPDEEVDRIAEKIIAVMDRQETEVFRLMDRPKPKAAPDEFVPSPGQQAAWALDVDKWAAEYDLRVTPALLRSLTDRAAATIAAFVEQGTLPEGAAFSVTNPAVQDFLAGYRFRLSDQLWGTVTRETNARLQAAFSEGIADGETMLALSKRVEKIFGSAKRHQSFRIATTEHSRAEHAGTEAGYIDSGVVEAKEWIVAFDACEFCATMSGRIVGLGQSFHNLGDTVQGTKGGALSLDYTTTEYPPLHPHCRCSLAPILVSTS